VQPVFVEKDGCIDSVILSVQAFEALSAASQPKTLAECQKAFNQTYKAWLVEQNARRCLQICDRGYVLDQGKDAYTGTGRELADDPKVIELYLGTLAKDVTGAKKK
jgi:branched-chain amino acid transport system ATP-binding protein